MNIENVNYIKIRYLDNDGFSHCTKAAINRISEVDIFATAKSEENMIIKTPIDAEVSIVADNGLYKAHTDIKRMEKDGDYVNFILKKPDEIDYQQNREYFRVKISENANITYKDEANTEHNIACVTSDISANGVSMIVDENYNIPEIVKIKLYFPEKTITSDAKFVRIDEEDGIKKLSFNYTDLKEHDLDYISQICLKKQLEQRRKALM